MAEFSLDLPALKSSKALLTKLDQDSRDQFTAELLDALWDAHDGGTLPSQVALLLRDWIAHAHFEVSPLVQERLAVARERSSTA